MKKIILIATSALLLSGCATWSHTEATKDGKPVEISTSGDAATKTPESIILSKEDITDKKYDILADLEVIVNKTTIFHADPTPAMVDQKLRVTLISDRASIHQYGSKKPILSAAYA